MWPIARSATPPTYGDGRNVRPCHAALLDQLEPDIATASGAAQNLIAHYRFASTPLPESSNDDINARWLSTILKIDQQWHGTPLIALSA